MRAVHREGELLQEYDGQGKRTDLEHGGDDPTKLSQREAAEAAGISKDQQVTAVRVASVPKDILDAVVDSDDPRTVTEIAAIVGVDESTIRADKSAGNPAPAPQKAAETAIFCTGGAENPAVEKATVTRTAHRYKCNSRKGDAESVEK